MAWRSFQILLYSFAMQTDLIDTIGVIYEAGLENDRWDEVLQSVVTAVDGQAGMLGFTDAASSVAQPFRTFGLDPELQRRWGEEFDFEDPWGDRVAALQEGEVVRGFDLFTYEELCAKRVYVEIAEPLGGRDVLASIVARNGRRVGWINAYESSREDGFSSGSFDSMVYLTPHLQRATRLHSQFVELRAGRDAGMAALDALSFGIITCDGSGRVVSANRRAEEILESGETLRVDRSILACADHRLSVRLAHLLKRCSETANLRSAEGGGAIVLPRAGHMTPLTALVAPLSRRREHGMRFAPVSTAESLVVITDPEQDVSVPDGLLRELYGLTDVESRVALSLANGGTVEEYAEQFQIKRDTARGHLKRVLSKTQTGKQSRLVSLLLRVLAPIR